MSLPHCLWIKKCLNWVFSHDIIPLIVAALGQVRSNHVICRLYTEDTASEGKGGCPCWIMTMIARMRVCLSQGIKITLPLSLYGIQNSQQNFLHSLTPAYFSSLTDRDSIVFIFSSPLFDIWESQALKSFTPDYLVNPGKIQDHNPHLPYFVSMLCFPPPSTQILHGKLVSTGLNSLFLNTWEILRLIIDTETREWGLFFFSFSEWFLILVKRWVNTCKIHSSYFFYWVVDMKLMARYVNM